MGYITDARNAIALKAANVPGVKGASGRLLEGPPPDSPWFVIGTLSAHFTPGQRERTLFVLPLRLYIERMPDDDTVMTLGDDLIELTLQEFSQGITLSTVAGASSTELRLSSASADNWVRLGGGGQPDTGTPYLMIEFTIELGITRARNYTA